MKITKRKHPYHILDSSPWPFFISVIVLSLTLSTVLYMHYFLLGYFLLPISIFLLIFVMSLWWRDVVREATFQRKHTIEVQRGLRLGVVLFIVSEVMFFFAFFWAFFHSSLAPSVEIGAIWPPKGIIAFNPFEIPLANTLILLLSGLTITIVHQSILVAKDKTKSDTAIFYFLVTILLAIFFTILQIVEYIEAPFSISDGIYGSTFFMATGFHGFHVLIGTIFIGVNFLRYLKGHYYAKQHVGFESAAWYWHFVDVVWLFLFISIYWWGGLA